MKKPVMCENSGAPIDLCPFEQVGHGTTSEYEPELVYYLDVCKACRSVRHRTKTFDQVIEEDQKEDEERARERKLERESIIAFFVLFGGLFGGFAGLVFLTAWLLGA